MGKVRKGKKQERKVKRAEKEKKRDKATGKREVQKGKKGKGYRCSEWKRRKEEEGNR